MGNENAHCTIIQDIIIDLQHRINKDIYPFDDELYINVGHWNFTMLNLDRIKSFSVKINKITSSFCGLRDGLNDVQITFHVVGLNEIITIHMYGDKYTNYDFDKETLLIALKRIIETRITNLLADYKNKQHSVIDSFEEKVRQLDIYFNNIIEVKIEKSNDSNYNELKEINTELKIIRRQTQKLLNKRLSNND
jgi:hypothetical protein